MSFGPFGWIKVVPDVADDDFERARPALAAEHAAFLDSGLPPEAWASLDPRARAVYAEAGRTWRAQQNAALAQAVVEAILGGAPAAQAPEDGSALSAAPDFERMLAGEVEKVAAEALAEIRAAENGGGI